jgi:hypothetical protein
MGVDGNKRDSMRAEMEGYEASKTAEVENTRRSRE